MFPVLNLWLFECLKLATADKSFFQGRKKTLRSHDQKHHLAAHANLNILFS